jgi:enamine deaminase RidA (YjgF/YER057c/UK114 family)
MPSDEIEERIRELGIVLPSPPAPKGAYLPVNVHGKYAWVSGMLPLRDGKLVAEGLVDSDVSVVAARDAARDSALNGLSALRNTLGGLDKVDKVLRVGVFVASSVNFISQTEVGNGASNLFIEVFGDRGKHARAAIGAARLPFNSPVEVEFQVALK